LRRVPLYQEVRNSSASFDILAEKTPMSLSVDISPAWVLEFFEDEGPRPTALYAVAAWAISVSLDIISSSLPLDIETDKA